MSRNNYWIVEMINEAYMLERKNHTMQSQWYYQLKMQQPKKERLYCRLCVWLGDKLVLLGVWLQQRFGKVEVVQAHEILVAGDNPS